MTDYKTIFGKKIKLQTTDLTMSTATEGELFYSNSDSEFKVGVKLTAWAAGENLPQQSSYLACCGPQTAGLVWSGQSPPLSPPYRDEAFTYDGTDWTASPDISQAKAVNAGTGTATAALSVGGYKYPPSAYQNDTEEYDGSSWSEVADYPTTIMSGGIAGTQTAAVVGGGTGEPGHTSRNVTNEYNGSAWTAGENMPASYASSLRAWGTQTAAVFCGGENPSVTGATLSYDGTDYTAESNSMNTARANHSCAQNGTATAGLIFAGAPSVKTNTESWNGTSWTNEPALGTARSVAGGFGTSTAAVCAGGNPFPSGAIGTEEFSETITLKTVTDS
jgi:hypothetical protein